MLIGTGILTWHLRERISDRYGTIFLHTDPDGSSKVPLDMSAIGQTGILLAKIVETRASRHIGDLFRGIFPRTPNRGDTINLGYGRLFCEEDGIGLKPVDDDREVDWLSPQSLYSCHDQTVELHFLPE